MENRDFVYKMVTDKVIEMMAQGVIPWHKPWHFASTNGEEVAINYVTRRPYSMINQWLLMEPGEYLTFKQITALNGHVKRGEKSRFVVFFTQVVYTVKNEKTGEDEERSYPLLRYYNVFHINQTEGIESKLQAGEKPEIVEAPRCEEADAAIDAYVASQSTLKFQNNKYSDKAYYSPALDTVVVPMRQQFEDMAEYYSTAFHELTHSTLTANRCNRQAKGEQGWFGSKAYSREELVAEMGAAMLCANYDFNMQKAFRNSVAYLQSWAKNLKDDPKAIVVAAGKAEKAVRFILGERENKDAE